MSAGSQRLDGGPTERKVGKRHHALCQIRAGARVKAVEEVTGNRLTRAMRKAAKAYASETLRDLGLVRPLYEYCAVHGDFKEGWLTYRYFRRQLVKNQGIGLERLSKIKTFTSRIFRTDALPDVGYYLNGSVLDAEMRPSSLAQLKECLRERGSEVAYVKPDGSVLGKQIYRVPVDELQLEVFEASGNAVVQYAVSQHPSFDEVMRDALATVRIITVRTVAGEIKPSAAYVRFGLAGTKWIISERAVRAAVVDLTGTLDDRCYTPDWKSWPAHPDTGVSLAGRSIPRFREATDFCVGLHREVPHPLMVGWDIAIDADEEIKLLEWNADHGDIRFPEAVSGPCFAQVAWPVTDAEQQQRCRHFLGASDDGNAANMAPNETQTECHAPDPASCRNAV